MNFVDKMHPNTDLSSENAVERPTGLILELQAAKEIRLGRVEPAGCRSKAERQALLIGIVTTDKHVLQQVIEGGKV